MIFVSRESDPPIWKVPLSSALCVATAVIMSMTASAPFSYGDSDIAVAYISAFILVGFVSRLFSLLLADLTEHP